MRAHFAYGQAVVPQPTRKVIEFDLFTLRLAFAHLHSRSCASFRDCSLTSVWTCFHEQAAEQARVAAEGAAAKAKEATESAGKGVTGNGSEAADAAVVEGEKGAGFFTGLWENAQKAAQDAQKSALEVCQKITSPWCKANKRKHYETEQGHFIQ